MNRIVTLGEILLRLKSPGRERLLQSPGFEASFGGGEANVALSLAGFGHRAAFVSVVPDHALGDAVIGELRRFGVDTSQIVRSGDRLGIYFLEAGANQRPSTVVYDRKGSAFAEARADRFDWASIFAGASWFHITGITPALSASAAEIAREACRQARQRGVRVSCDLSYRDTLWRYGRTAPEVMREIFSLVDVGIGGREDCQRALGIGDIANQGATIEQTFAELTDRVMQGFSNLATLTLTLRESQSADRNRWTACLRDKDGFILGPGYEIDDIVDRVGAGDAFAAGLIHGLIRGDEAAAALAFATAAGCLKHSICGDFNRVSVAEVERLVAGDASGRVQR